VTTARSRLTLRIAVASAVDLAAAIDAFLRSPNSRRRRAQSTTRRGSA
jgi:hypothetical protein